MYDPTMFMSLIENVDPAQRQFLSMANQHKKLIVNCNPGPEASRAAAAYMLWTATSKPERTIVNLACSDWAAKEMIECIHQMHGRLEPWGYSSPITKKNRHEIQFETGSRILCRSTPYVFRGMAVSLFVWSDCAFGNFQRYEDGQEILDFYSPSLYLSRMLLYSAESRAPSFFNGIWSQAKNGTNIMFQPLDLTE